MRRETTMMDEALVRACRAGDRAAFGELYDRYIKRIYTYIYYKTHHRETAEDLASRTFLKALERIHTFDPDQRFGAWLYRVARNTVIDHYRAAKPLSDIEDAWDVPDASDIQIDADMRRDSRKLWENMKSLPSIQRDILVLRLWDGLSYREIAEIVQKKEGNCKVMFSRAVAELRSSMTLAALMVLIQRL